MTATDEEAVEAARVAAAIAASRTKADADVVAREADWAKWVAHAAPVYDDESGQIVGYQCMLCGGRAPQPEGLPASPSSCNCYRNRKT